VLSVQGDPREMWKRLQARYSNKGENAKVIVYNTIVAVSLKADGNVRCLISDLEVLYDQLLGMGDDVSESQRVAKLLGAVRDEYESVVTALRIVSGKIMWDSVAARIQDAYDCRESSSPKNKKKAEDAQEAEQRKDRPKCYGCGKVGHKIRDSKNKEEDTSDTESEKKVERRRAKSNSAKKAMDKKVKTKDRTLISVEGTVTMQSRVMYDRDEAADEFFIDSGASSHMSATDDIMINLSEIPEREILTAHMQTLVCHSMGDVDIVLYDEDGKRTTKATMKDVLFVQG
jgi:gag-polypeptide of LTR copia-type